jgi:hypothetical protein
MTQNRNSGEGTIALAFFGLVILKGLSEGQIWEVLALVSVLVIGAIIRPRDAYPD